MIEKTQIVKCSDESCGAELDEATDTITYIDGKPYCVYCHPTAFQASLSEKHPVGGSAMER